MGILCFRVEEETTMIKTAIVAFCAALAAAQPEADSEAFLGNFGYGYNNYGYGIPMRHSYGPYGYGYNRLYNNYNNGFYGKRDAEAEPEAKAEPEAFFGNYGYGYPSFGYGYNSPAEQHYSYGFNRFQRNFGNSRFFNNYNNGFYGKREAEAEPEAEASFAYGTGVYNGYSGFYRPTGYSNYGYNRFYNNYGYGYNRFY